eukprot:CAMPEP_0116844392 /NCGR_PEP_ID=MMETSP0418-20121206/12658_1 /TAXON_ID=1158023 /ORGANISM="Astrosyne radiata, Strain 13vi08-1A" /LENGTH=242 /DNA_ID=CAMNT_0004475331 /DNA_START=72 /DNA_END=803 /DNA_ORIENTATION=+
MVKISGVATSPFSEIMTRQQKVDVRTSGPSERSNIATIPLGPYKCWTKPKRQASRKRVCFHDAPTKIQNPPVTAEEARLIWYNADDLAALRTDTKLTIQALRKAGDDVAALDEDKYCLRGLEDYSPRGGQKERKERTFAVVNGILEEQHKQRTIGIYDPLLLQALACACSRPSKHKALMMGTKDAREARSVMQETTKISGRRAQRNVVAADDNEEKIISHYRPFKATLNLRKRLKQSSARSA